MFAIIQFEMPVAHSIAIKSVIKMERHSSVLHKIPVTALNVKLNSLFFYSY